MLLCTNLELVTSALPSPAHSRTTYKNIICVSKGDADTPFANVPLSKLKVPFFAAGGPIDASVTEARYSLQEPD